MANNLKEFLDKVKNAAETFGFDHSKNGIFRDAITDKYGNIRTPNSDDDNFWFGYIREDQPTSGAYEGFSFVVFPETDGAGTRCLVAIGIGSSSIGKDGDLAVSAGFRRSFMRLTGERNAKFFFKLHFDDMETSTPGLQEELSDSSKNYDQVMINTVTKYNADPQKNAPGLLPAAFIVDYSNDDGIKLIKAWLAQYAQWRCWDRFQNGKHITGKTGAIQEAISACRNNAKCPEPDDIDNLFKAGHRYIVLQGAPGCGKTWTANKVADKFNDVIFTQFHAETTYADFVYGIRPTLNGTNLAYKGEKGVLLRAIDMAKEKTDERILLIIDEINRANLANVLGPVFYLFEPNTARNHKLRIGTTYDETHKKEVSIELCKLPENLYVLATMNTADKSLAVVDFALRRRFLWVTLRPHSLNNCSDFDYELFNKVDEIFSKYATDEELNLQPGQSYFMDKNKRKETIIYGLMPLMKEYFAEGFLLAAKEEFAQLFYSETGVFMYE